MKTRIITAAVMAVVGIPILIFSKYIVFPIALSILSAIAVFEMMKVLGVHKNYLLTAPLYAIALAMPTLSYFFAEDYTLAFILVTAAVLFAYLIYAFFVAVFMRGNLKYTKVCEIFSSSVYPSTTGPKAKPQKRARCKAKSPPPRGNTPADS